MEPWPEQLAPYIPTGLADPRLRQQLIAAPGTKSFNSALSEMYSAELYRYGEKLVNEKKYREAIAILDRSLNASRSANSVLALGKRAESYLVLATRTKPPEQTRYYQLALADANSLLKAQDLDVYTIPKLKALIGLGRRQEAIDCCNAAYAYAQIFGQDTAKLSGYLLKLTGKSKPDNILAVKSRDLAKVRDTVLRMVKNDVTPKLDYGRRDQSAVFSEIFRFNTAGYGEPNAIGFMINPATAAITPTTVREWLGADAKSQCQIAENESKTRLTAKYPWGELTAEFNHPSTLASCFSFKKETAVAATGDEIFRNPSEQEQAIQAAKNQTAIVETNNGPPTFAENLSKIDKLLDTGHYNDVITQVDATLSWAGNPSTKATKEAIRPRLVRLAEAQNKSRIAAYLKEAPFSQIALLISAIKLEERTEFFTPEEYASKKYYLKGNMKQDGTGSCEIWGGRNFEPVCIQEKAEAASKLFAALQIKLPFDYGYEAQQIAPPPGLLIDAVLDEQQERATKIWQQTQKEREENNLVH
ncbi:hypothetical protein KBI23_25735 [bacterium]|nr:hypothetical protein [bacterium]MBP9806749.1 hypothetical protein [bacterium]